MEDLPLVLRTLLTKFGALFRPHHAMPPARDTNHHIHLLPQSTPVNMRPYRYPHFQKREIELQIDSMLQKVLIQPSTSPFSLLVLLVKKQDGSWRFYVDYKALNALTIKDRFPIPMCWVVLSASLSLTYCKGIIKFACIQRTFPKQLSELTMDTMSSKSYLLGCVMPRCPFGPP